MSPSQSHSHIPGIFFSIVILVGGLLTVEWFIPGADPPLLDYLVQPGCRVKGNVSHKDGKRVYHLPDMEDYAATVIDPRRGEKWFCSEVDAQNSGWTKASDASRF